MAWRIRFSKEADKSLRKLDRHVSARILDELEEVSRLDDPRSRGKALVGNLAGLWRYRAGDYRVVCDIEDEVLVILVVGVAHRSSVYRRR
ncbi:MAG: type II toxin-antitoxin system RelE/ParE family toxin [Tractidigestivibacter sp.]|uniref:type II toxin-antitoxin system RelE family toxin n=1 Tax=Tractidigestivibacter sp. TaxID=2847320 RepID=UPI002A811A86|nr:type II toxin-antitoxin system RelE/ParE family toxin [Tractidigestivibacter sp.]MDY4533774.1 type II toxin-antitoxin system RelE/ParE family toxin [Tractidigestivibacter sp.]